MNRKGRGDSGPFCGCARRIVAVPGGNADMIATPPDRSQHRPGRIRLCPPPRLHHPAHPAMETIQAAKGGAVSLFEQSKRPPSPHITTDDASWSGMKE